MPFRLPFNFPYGYNYNYRRPVNHFPSNNSMPKKNEPPKITPPPKPSEDSSDEFDYFFEIFGLRLYFDDVLIICILFFLYTEEVHDQELFLCLVLLLLS